MMLRSGEDRRSLRVLLVTSKYLPQVGGTELHVHEVAQRLVAREVDVTILTTDLEGTLPPSERVAGVTVRRVPAWPRTRDYFFAPQIYGEITRGSWDVVHVQGYHTLVAPLAMLASLRAHTPYVVTFHAGGHSSRVRHALRPTQFAVLRPLLARADRLVALAPFEVDAYSQQLRLSRTQFVVIPNGSDLGAATPIAASPDPSLIASLGRLERYKGHHRVIEAMPHIVKRKPDVRLWIGGSGPYEPSLRTLAESLGVAEHVEIRAIPAIDRGLLADQLSRVKLVVSLSEFETQPLAALEALALGCRLLVADTSGLRELARNGLARSLPLYSSATEVAAAILEELDAPPPITTPRLPTWDECTDALLQLYRSLGSPASAP